MQPSFAVKLQPLPSTAVIKLAPLNLIDAKAQIQATADEEAINELAVDMRRLDGRQRGGGRGAHYEEEEDLSEEARHGRAHL